MGTLAHQHQRHRVLGILLVNADHSANLLSLLSDVSEFARQDESSRYTVAVVGPSDCMSAMVRQAVIDFDEEHSHDRRVRLFAQPQSCSSSSAPDALARAAQACILLAEGADEVVLIHTSVRFLYNHVSAASLFQSMLSSATGMGCDGVQIARSVAQL